MIRIGIDIGSTTVKMAVIDEHGTTCFTRYERHNAEARRRLVTMLRDLRVRVGNADVAVSLTGSVGMGLSEQTALPFVQEVVAASHYVQAQHPAVQSLIDIGGEDAKVVFFRDGRATDLRMNGNCAGGTGAFIDQMAILLGVKTEELGRLAAEAKTVHTIASRCGVFAKTDVQNLIARGVSREDIAASVLHAVAVQTVVTLAHGEDITPPVMLCGGPLTFIPALRRAFADYLKFSETTDFVLPTDSHLIPALGAALSASTDKQTTLDALIETVESSSRTIETSPNRSIDKSKACGAEVPTSPTTLQPSSTTSPSLRPIFTSEAERTAWRQSLQGGALEEVPLRSGRQRITLGIDSGSTTTKVVALDEAGRLVFHFYAPNSGDPIGTARRGLEQLRDAATKAGAELDVVGSCSTGYGEDLLKACFGLTDDIIETIAHYMAARQLAPDVSFILDIGGQDMKAIFVNDGVIDRIEINEACSSGCGSFIETFARSLGYSLEDFAALACTAVAPYDLGTRCTVFMNSKVKQALREGASVGDIAAGLFYSVVKNCLYKVLRLKSTTELGNHIVVQGGTMKNDAVVRAFELTTGCRVHRSTFPELMGAVGCALYAREAAAKTVAPAAPVSLDALLALSAEFKTSERQCHGCENQCRITAYQFAAGRRYYSGNRCENVFTNRGRTAAKGENAYAYKLQLLFDRPCEVETERGTVGLPRALNMFEEYPFWHALFTTCGIRPVLSAPSTMPHYEACARQVMSDNICFPAKLVHSHIEDLAAQGVTRIFMPYVVYERSAGGRNSFNCPIVTAYSEVVKGSAHSNIPLDTPAITFKDAKLLQRQCVDYLHTTWGISVLTAERAVRTAVKAYDDYAREMAHYNHELLCRARSRGEAGRLTILLAGRPYHADPLIQHKIADIIAAQGVDVLTDDIVRSEAVEQTDVNFFSQWAFPHRILKAATWAARQPADLQFMEMTSFGCGPDAFLTDEVRDLLRRHHKPMALLKLDDVSNMGSVKLRVRSVIESLKLAAPPQPSPKREGVAAQDMAVTLPSPSREGQGGAVEKLERRKLLVPFFTPFISPLIPSFLAYLGYDAECLPISDRASCEAGLRHANNEVCYPATLIVGDIVKAFTSGHYDPQRTAVVMTQTGGQCRATNYVAVIRKALREAGFPDVPVLSLAASSGLDSDEQRLHLPRLKALPIAVTTLFFSDSLAKYYYAALPREREKGTAAALLQHYLTEAQPLVATGNRSALWSLLERAADDFEAAVTPASSLSPVQERNVGAVGIVGEIFLKFHPFAQLHLTEHLTARGLEVIPPLLTDFFLQSFVNARVNKENHLDRSNVPNFVLRLLNNMVWQQAERANKIGHRFRYFRPFERIDAKAEEAERVISLCAQFGEGWLLPGEVLSMARGGVTHVISLQPFGCIANHIVAKGIEKRLKTVFPALQFLTLDFDSSVSDVNISNRLLLFLDSLRPSA